ncbi:MAG: excinuclease ABC subunit UvrC [Candidatus Omnitrophica bacterium]|nr:excinuclease ABC subunit UvrC [Candidatus Omnitrophota bacterium]
MDIKEKIKNIPDAPGVYLFKDKDGKVIYIGKASSLRKRVMSHFSQKDSLKEEILKHKVRDVEYLPTVDESFALLWEAALIREKQPTYNVNYRDDKSYPFLKISIAEKFPPIFIGRGKGEKKWLYFGPYSNVKLLREAVKTIRKIFPFRSCRILPKKPCLYYALRLCPGPCVGKVSEEEYRKIISQIVLLLEGRREELEKELIKKMQEKAALHNFEEAAQIRDQIQGLSQLKALRLGTETVLKELKDVLGLKRFPYRIEAFDLSHLSGSEAVGAMVSFYRGVPDKNNYRRFRVKTAHPQDDLSMLKEVIWRRFRRLSEENKELPELVIIDGGKTHLETAFKEIEKLGIEVDLISLAKGEELIYTLKKKAPLMFPRDSVVLRFIQRIRDEAHRFAINYHKRLHRKNFLLSKLDRIKGIGDKRKKELLKHFGSVEILEKANLDEVAKVKGMNRKIAETLLNSLKTNEK